MTVKTTVIELILARHHQPYVKLTPQHRLQVINDVEDLPHCQRNQYAAFVASRGMLVVWADDPGKLYDNAEFIQNTLMNKIWMKDAAHIPDEKRLQLVESIKEEEPLDSESIIEKPRRIVLNQAFGCAVTLVLACAAVGSGWKEVAVEISVDHNYLRMAFLVTIVPQLWFSLVSPIPYIIQQLADGNSSSFKRSSATSSNSSVRSGKCRKTQSTTRASRPEVFLARTDCRTLPYRCRCTRKGSKPS